MCFTLALAYALALASVVNYDCKVTLQIVASLTIIIMTIVIVL